MNNKELKKYTEKLKKTVDRDLEAAFSLVKENPQTEDFLFKSEELVNLLAELSSKLWESNKFEKAAEINNILLKTAKKQNKPREVIVNLIRNSAIHINLIKYRKAIECLKEASEIIESESLENESLAINVYINLGIAYLHTNNLENSYDSFIKGEKLATKQNDKESLIQIYLNLQYYFNAIDDQDSVEKIGKKGLKLSQESDNDFYSVSFINTLGTTAFENKDYSKAKYYFEKSIELLRKKDYKKDWLANSLMNLGVVENVFENYDKSIEYLQKAIDISENYNLLPIKGLALMNKALTYEKAKGDDEKILKCFNKSEAILREVNYFSNLLEILKYKEKYYNKKGLFKDANKILKEIIELKEKSFSDELNKRIANMKTKFEIEQTEREKKILEQKNQELQKRNQNLKKAQKKIRKLEQKNTIYAMAVTANHELNQPLSVVSGNIEMALIKLDKDRHLKKYLDKSAAAVQKMKEILNKFKNIDDFKFKKYAEKTYMVTFDNKKP